MHGVLCIYLFLCYNKFNRLRKMECMDKMRDTGIKEVVISEIISLAMKHKLNKVILFGSRARGDYGTKSDIDLAASGGNIIAFALDVDEETSTLLKFDVVNLDLALNRELLEAIAKEGKVIYEKV